MNDIRAFAVVRKQVSQSCNCGTHYVHDSTCAIYDSVPGEYKLVNYGCSCCEFEHELTRENIKSAILYHENQILELRNLAIEQGYLCRHGFTTQVRCNECQLDLDDRAEWEAERLLNLDERAEREDDSLDDYWNNNYNELENES
ncbi:MAG TPA: hypothetical protein VIH90_01025 [Candidatus Saccharimonadales bacterium]